MKAVGKKGREWANAREYLTEQFFRLGITYCEANLTGCWIEPHGFAHILRRRHFGKWDTEERRANLFEVVLLCNICHDYIDVVMGEVRGGKYLRKIIARRKGKPSMFEDLKGG